MCLVTRLIILEIIKILIIAIMVIIVIIIVIIIIIIIIILIVTNSDLHHDVKLGMEKCSIASVSKT